MKETATVVKTNQPHFVTCGFCGKKAPLESTYRWLTDHYDECHSRKSNEPKK